MCGCVNSSAPHLSSLTVGEWSPKGLGGRLPPVREADRLKPRQQGLGVVTVAAHCSLGGQENLSASFRGSLREAGEDS